MVSLSSEYFSRSSSMMLCYEKEKEKLRQAVGLRQFLKLLEHRFFRAYFFFFFFGAPFFDCVLFIKDSFKTVLC
jgi:hypothetical protein